MKTESKDTNKEENDAASNASWGQDPESLVKEEKLASVAVPSKTELTYCVPKPSTPLVKKIRIVYSDMQPIEVRTTHTVAALFLGEKSYAENVLFEACIKEKIHFLGLTGPFWLWLTWYIGAVLGVLTVAKVLPMHFVWASLLMVPLPMVTISLMSTDMLTEVFRGLDLYIIYILQFALFVDGVYFCKLDQRTVFWICYCPTMFASGLMDAYPAKYRPMFAKLFFSAMLAILIVWNCLMIFRWNAFGSLHKMANISFVLHHISDQATLGVFYCRHLYVSIYKEDYFVMIKADCCTGHHECQEEEEVLEGGTKSTKMLFHHKRNSEVRMKTTETTRSDYGAVKV